MSSRKKAAAAAEISDHDQFWLDHQAAQVASGQTAKEYAAAEGLSVQALYQARKKLRRAGLLAPYRDPSKPGKKSPGKRTVSFSQVALAKVVSDSRFRLELPSGIALEWDGSEVPASVVSLLERLAARP